MTNRTNHENRLSVLENRSTRPVADDRPLKVQVVSGTAYLTREGDDRDYVLESGEVISFQDKGRIVVQGLPYATYRVLAR